MASNLDDLRQLNQRVAEEIRKLQDLIRDQRTGTRQGAEIAAAEGPQELASVLARHAQEDALAALQAEHAKIAKELAEEENRANEEAAERSGSRPPS